MEYKETQNSILFKNEYEEEFLKLTKEFGVDAVSKAYSNDEFSIYFFSCIEDQDKINSLMNSLKKKTKCDIIENFDLDNNELSTRTKTNSGYRKTTKSLKDLIQKRISKEEFSKINDKLDYELLNKNSIQEKIKVLSHELKEDNVKCYIDNKTVNLGTFVSDQEGTYTIKLSGYVVDGDTLSKKNISDEVSITVSANTNSSDNQGNTGNTDTTPAAKSKEARLKTFGITPNDFKGFKKDKTEYSTEVPNDVSEVSVYATAVDSKAKVTGRGKVKLKEGSNTVKVTVTAEAGNTKVYTLTIKRKAADANNSTTNDGSTNTDNTASTNNTNTTSASTSSKVGLESLEIKDVELTPSFKTEVYNYQVELDKDVESLDISAIPIEDDTSVEIAGNQDFKEGENIVTILVKNEKTEKTITYQITVNKNVTSEDQGTVEEFSWFKPSTWGREIIIKAVIAVVLVILIIIAVILKIKLSREKKGKNKIDLPGADELDKALAEHQELTELENTEDDNYYTVNNENQEQDQIQEQTIHQYDSESSQESNAYKFKNDYDGNYIEDIAKSKNYDIDDNDNNDYSYDYQDDNSRRTKRKGRGKHF